MATDNKRPARTAPRETIPAAIEGLGVFYLGQKIDQDSGTPSGEPLLVDAKRLTTHAVCVGHAIAFGHWLLKDDYPANVTAYLIEGERYELGEGLSQQVDEPAGPERVPDAPRLQPDVAGPQSLWVLLPVGHWPVPAPGHPQRR